MNSNQWTTTSPNRVSCAAAALLASTVVLSSVLWLFADISGTPAGASVIVAHQQPARSDAQHSTSRLASSATTMTKL